jgi:tellurite resistance protein
MSDRDAFKERERALEESYFQKKERELIERQREKVAIENARAKLAEKTGVTNEEILEALEELGYDHETVRLLHLMPVIYIAWADGKMRDKERRGILEVARLAGISEGSKADERLGNLIESAPSDEVWEASFLAIQAVLRAGDKEKVEHMRKNVLSYCESIASLSKGLFGLELLGTGAERAALERVTRELGVESSKAAKDLEDRLQA